MEAKGPLCGILPRKGEQPRQLKIVEDVSSRSASEMVAKSQTDKNILVKALEDGRLCWVKRGPSLGIDIALDEMHSSAVLSLLFFFCEVAVGVDASVERDQSTPTQAAPQQARFGPD